MTDQPALGATDGAPSSKSSARAAAARRNGALSSGPKTAAGKQRSAQNALKHGLRAQRFVLLDDEDSDEFAVLEEALREQLTPDGALQEILFARLTLAVWRMFRTDRMEAELLNPHLGRDARGRPGGLGLALMRDGHGPRAFDTLSRYRGAVQAEFWRALRGLCALKAGDPDAAAERLGAALSSVAGAPGGPPPLPFCPAPDAGAPAAAPAGQRRALALETPNEPKSRSRAGKAAAERAGRPYGILAKIGG